MIYLAVMILPANMILNIMFVTILYFWMKRNMKKAIEDNNIIVESVTFKLLVRGKKIENMLKMVKELRIECLKKDGENEKLREQLDEIEDH